MMCFFTQPSLAKEQRAQEFFQSFPIWFETHGWVWLDSCSGLSIHDKLNILCDGLGPLKSSQWVILGTYKTYLMAPSYLAAEILQLAELHLAVLGRLSETFKEWNIEWLFQVTQTQESD